MTYSNNSRNIANLLRSEPLQPIQPRRQQQILPPQLISQNNGRQNQIPTEEVFTPEQGIDRRLYRRKTPMSSGNTNQGSLFPVSNHDDTQIDSIRIRLEQIIKFYDERHRNLQTNLSQRLNGLENIVMREMPKVDNANMIKNDFVSFKQIVKQLRKQLQYQNQQIIALKAMAPQKSYSDVALINDAKEKQKITVLFLEVVRLADTVEKMETGMGSVGRNYESRLQQLQHKISNSDRNLALMSQRTTNGNDMLSQFGAKVIDRLQTAQNNLLSLGHERVKDKQTINDLKIQNERMTQNLQSLLRNMQGDFQNKLENRISQTINRLITEHEQRVNAQEQIRRNLDIRERISQEKQNNDKQQFRARYENMDVLVRNQFQRKEQSIRQLSVFIEGQVKNVQKQIAIQGNNRKQQESIFRTQMKRIQDSFRKQYDLYKTHQSDVLQRIGQLVKQQVQVRVNSQINLKKLTSDIANELVNDLNGVKQAISTSNKKLNMSIREVANESSQRSGQLSHYIDSEVKKVVEVVTEKYSKMKNVFTKLAQQLRQHLTNTEKNRANVEKRLTILQQNFEKLKTQVVSQIDQFYNDLDARLKDQKQYVETVVFKKNNELQIRINKLQQYTNNYFELIKVNLEQNKQILNNKITSNSQPRSQEGQQEMKEMRKIILNIKNLAIDIQTQNKQSLEQFRKQLKQKQRDARKKNQGKQEGLLEKVQKNTKQIVQIQQVISEINIKLNSLRAGGSGGTSQSLSNQKLKKVTDEVQNLQKKLKQISIQVDQSCKQNETEIIKLRTDIVVLKGEVGALDHDIKKISS